MKRMGRSKDTGKGIWYTKGWKEWELGWRTKFLIWLVRQFYRLRLISEEDARRYVHEAIDAALIKKYGDSLRIERVKLNQDENNSGNTGA